VTGATGFVGRRLVRALEAPAVLSRDAERARRALGPAVRAFAWDPDAGPPPAAAFEGIEAVFHLAGEPVARRWTRAVKDRIRDSRVGGTRNLVAALEALKARPRVLVAGSAVGWYGDRGDELLDESSSPGDDFLARLCREWEAESSRAEGLGVRAVVVRTGIVLGRDGGALARMLPPFRMGAGGRLGGGRQWMSWIHLDDLAGLMLHAARTEALRGPVNGTAPAPVTNAEFTRILAGVLRRPAFFPVPPPVLRLAFGEGASVLLSSQRALPRAAERSGYAFRHTALDPALREILGR
jgi:uncharacterized protein (TIGR01777 family)